MKKLKEIALALLAFATMIAAVIIAFEALTGLSINQVINNN